MKHIICQSLILHAFDDTENWESCVVVAYAIFLKGELDELTMVQFNFLVHICTNLESYVNYLLRLSSSCSFLDCQTFSFWIFFYHFQTLRKYFSSFSNI